MKRAILIYEWYGVLAILLAYFLLSFSIIDSNNIWYQILNGTGALGIVLAAYQKKDYQSMVLNVIWTSIATVTILVTIF